MTTGLPARDYPRNVATSVASPSAFVVLCSRPNGSDAAEIILRDEIVAEPEQARRFARVLLRTATLRHGAGLVVQVIDSRNVPVAIVEGSNDG